MLCQMDMREFLNAPNGSAQPAVSGNGRQESGSPQSPLGGKTVCMHNLL
jgi:X breakpoint 2-interacting protein